MSLMGYREYGRHRKALGLPGWTLGAVQRAIDSGRITAVEGKKIDSAAADLAWAKATDEVMQRKAAIVMPVTTPAAAPLFSGEGIQAPGSLARRLDGPDWPELPPMRAWSAEPDGPKGQLVGGSEFMAYKTAMVRLDYEERIKKVVPADEMRRTFAQIGRVYAQQRETLPGELATKLVGLTDVNEIQKRIREGMRNADARIADEILSRFGDVAAAG